jgi:hypothetical protein
MEKHWHSTARKKQKNRTTMLKELTEVYLVSLGMGAQKERVVVVVDTTGEKRERNN